MLKFLTYKLRTHSINDDNFAKADEDHDSGTESDDEIEDHVLNTVEMSERICNNVSPADTGCSMESPAPDREHDPHSSEEELEVINNSKEARSSERTFHHHHHHLNHNHPQGQQPQRATSVCLPEKRKWSQRGDNTVETSAVTGIFDCSTRYSPENEENMSHYGNISSSASPCSLYGGNKFGDDAVHLEHSGSSDDEVHHLLATPVQFRTSPPLEAVRPGGKTPNHIIRSLSPPSKLLHYEVSPRKRSRHTRHTHIQRPCLDFEKMQQLKARSVTPWRNSGEHGGELSVFCW
ncbi:TSC22 domain family protein 1-like isoform X2 [Agrilus planipennis]|uniref:TSC22 domain family protein 1-like isoform X2 n=1 Tax=Agrilus planipennis TaxID=224129 RepID=A0A7F5R3X0_AGRPL|nr:TSC22 domain family protein 1-like isoform X2 [Agrilus planipennis]